MVDEQDQNIKNDQGELVMCQQQCDEYLNNWKRERADFINYKKDEAKRMEEFARFSGEVILLEVIEVLDDLERAAGEINSDGLKQVLKKFQNLLRNYSIEKINTDGAFDPLMHEVVITETHATETQNNTTEAQNDTAETQNSTTETQNGEEKMEKGKETEGRIEEIRAGYMMHGKVIRPARVKIIK